MNGHPNGCQCQVCLAEKVRPNTVSPPGVYAYAAPVPGGWYPCPPAPVEPYPAIVMYMAGVPDQPFPGSWPAGKITFTPAPESPELGEIRKLREEVAKLAKTQAGMVELVKRALAKGRKS